MTGEATIYNDELARIHHEGFGEFAESAAPGLLEILWRSGVSTGLVVDAGCGSGIWARELLRAGFDVFAFDASPSMIALARQVAPAAKLEIASVDDVMLPPCDAVTAIGEILNYGASLPNFFRRVHAALRLGGVFVFDLAEPSEIHGGERRIDGEDWVVFTRKTVDGATLTRHITTYREIGDEIRKSEEVHVLRLYSREAVVSMLRDAGFRVGVRRSYGTRRLPPAHHVFVAQRHEKR
jgi:SAM-dependent methyltransferase